MSQAHIARKAYRLKEAAQIAGNVSMRTIYNWRDRQGLRITNVAGIPMIFEDDLEAFLAKFRTPEAV